MPLYPTKQDMAQVAAWGTEQDPFLGLKAYRGWQLYARWLNPWHIWMHLHYYLQRRRWVGQRDMEQYFQDADRTIDFEGWSFLKQRKAWFILPFHWDAMAGADVHSIIDFGCGDGDVTQRVAEYIAQRWAETGGAHPLRIVGLDISSSRIANARRHCRPPHELITMEFHTVDQRAELEFADREFDYALCTGVLEILDDKAARSLAGRLARLVRRGIYLEDLLDRYPGGFPRQDLGALFAGTGFTTRDRCLVLDSPFTWVGLADPMKLWPLTLDHLVWLERAD